MTHSLILPLSLLSTLYGNARQSQDEFETVSVALSLCIVWAQIVKAKTFVTFFPIAERRFKSLYLSQFRRNMSDLPRCNYLICDCLILFTFYNVAKVSLFKN